MEPEQKGLQKLTESNVDKVLNLDAIQRSDLDSFSVEERAEFDQRMNQRMNELTGVAHDNFLKKVDGIISINTKNRVWENNHVAITNAIIRIVGDCGCMPTVTSIKEHTSLSRQTIYKHMKEYHDHDIHSAQIEQFRFMKTKLLASVLKQAINGDVRAAKLYFSVVGDVNEKQSSHKPLIQNQNNYIQINGMVLSQETILQLKPEQLNSIESILKDVLPQRVVVQEGEVVSD